MFDSRGTVLPFALRAPAEESQASRHTVPVRVFPVFGLIVSLGENLAIGLVTAALLEWSLRDERRVLTVSRVQDGVLGLRGVALSLPLRTSWIFTWF